MIFLQAAARPNGPAAALLELVEIGELELFVSEACLEEIREVLINKSSTQVSIAHDFCR
jgi:predicted nucleic acid-binding protein